MSLISLISLSHIQVFIYDHTNLEAQSTSELENWAREGDYGAQRCAVVCNWRRSSSLRVAFRRFFGCPLAEFSPLIGNGRAFF